MRLKFTPVYSKFYFNKPYFFIVLLSLFSTNLWAQSFVNGNLSTGSTSSNGVAAPTGFTWSEVQNGNESSGFSASIDLPYSIADDFVIPDGETWNLTNIKLYAYSTGSISTTSPFNVARLQIFSTDPSTGSPTPVFGDLTTNRYLSAVSSGMYRIFFASPGTTRKIWEITASAATTLSAGHYWVEWQIGTVAAGASNFSPASTEVGTVTQAGNNALQHDLSTNTWDPLLDGLNQQDSYFKINYTNNCTNPDVPVIHAAQSTICVGQSTTLSVVSGNLNNAANWEWYSSSCGGTVVGSGFSINVSPAVSTTYYVRGVGGCISNGDCAEISVTVSACQCLTPDVATICAGEIKPLSVTQSGGTSQTYNNTNLITISNSTDPSNPYPSVINISGLPTSGLAIKSVTINGVNHDWSDDLDIALVAPSGDAVILMSDAGSFNEIVNANFTFSDDATQFIPEDDQPTSGIYHPTNYGTPDDFPAPGPGTLTQPNPSLSSLTGDVNGDWKLFVVDDFIGFGGSISGWSITFTTQNTASWSPAESLFSNPEGTIPYVAGTQALTVYAAPVATTTYTANIVGGPCNGNNTVTVNVNNRPAVTVSPAEGGCGPITLTASGAASYSWSPAAGLNNVTGETVTADPSENTLYTVSGSDANGCSTPASVQIYSASTSAVLTGTAPSIIRLNENFDSGIPADWPLINNSDIIGFSSNWSQGNSIYFPANSGASDTYASADYELSNGDIISSWMLTKEVPIANGDKFSFYTRTTDGMFPDRLELRMSTAGASQDVGSTATSVGDFTNLLLTINPDLSPGNAYPNTWTKFEVTVSGLASPVTGRFGFRYWVEDIFNNADYIGVDDVILETPQSCSPANTAQNMAVNIIGGAGPFTVVYSDGTTNTTINNYESGSLITVSPAQSTTFSLVSVTGVNGCLGTNLSGTNFVNVAPVIIEAPSDTSVCIGGSSSFSISSTGSDLTYQWQYSNDGGANWVEVSGNEYSGIDSSTLVINNGIASMDSLLFRVVFGNSTCGEQTSPSAMLTTVPALELTAVPSDTSVCAGGSAEFSISSPQNILSYQWQSSDDGGTTWMDVSGSEYSGINSPVLSLNNVTVSMNSLLFRVLFSNSTCGDQASPAGMLTIVPSPEVKITAAPYVALYPGLSTTLTANVNPGAANPQTYQWFLNGIAITGATNQSYNVNVDGLGIYYAEANTNGCYSQSSSLTIRDSANYQLFIYPSPTTGQFTVRYWTGKDNRLKPEALTIFDSKGSRIFTRHYSITEPFQEMKVDLTKYSRGIYWVELTDISGKRIKTGRVIIH